MRNLGSHRGLILCVRVLIYDCVSTLVCARQSAAENTFLGHFATHPALAQTSGFSSLLYRHLRPSTPDCSLCLVPTSISYLSGRRCPMCNLSTKDSESDNLQRFGERLRSVWGGCQRLCRTGRGCFDRVCDMQSQNR